MREAIAKLQSSNICQKKNSTSFQNKLFKDALKDLHYRYVTSPIA